MIRENESVKSGKASHSPVAHSMIHENGLTHTIGRLWRAVRTGSIPCFCVDGSSDPSNRGAAPILAPIFKAGTKRIWPAICLASVIVILSGYILLVFSNAIYLGFHDSLYFFSHPRLWDRLALTAWTATFATCLSLAFGIPAGYALSRFRFPFPRFMATLIDLPVLVPPAAVGAFLFGFTHTPPVRNILIFFGVDLGHTTAGVVFAQFMVTVAFCARLMKTSFDAVNPRFEFVSRSLGASRVRTFFQITLPLARRGILASLIVVWARAAAEWESLMLFVGGTEGRTDTLPFAVYLDWNGGMMGWVVSLSLVCILMAIAAMGAVRIIGRKSYVW